MSKYRAYVFTLNNYTDDAVASLDQIDCVYMVYGKEVAPETGTPHLQGYIYFKSRRAVKPVRKLLEGCHVEAAKGSAEQNREYCTKDGNATERGEMPRQGTRSDLEVVKEIIVAGGTVADVIPVATSYQSIKTAEVLLKYLEPQRDWKPTVKWYHGKTGTGKTREAFAEMENPYLTIPGSKWFDGYDGHENVIIDDFRPDQYSFPYLLRLLDRYPMRVETKGGTRQFRARNITITCPFPPALFPSQNEDVGQLLRRIDLIKLFQLNNGSSRAQSDREESIADEFKKH